ncbi:serine hydrolase domain-containing protein [Qipengyuania mesophila]|uniref:serine hydrolase domain-containing protein n=1 Tax=Qipengyuania mesophila TaxID=2867246 RepID=UPI0035182006
MRKTLLAVALSLAGCTTVARPDPATPAAVAVVFDRETATPATVEGLADRETGRAVEANDPVRIASISKLVMALATLRLVEEGKVDLGTDVSNYLGWPLRNPRFPEARVTLGQLLRHRSGLRDDAGYVIPLGESLQAELADPRAWYADAPPGEAPFEYANLGSPVVATVLEAASGERYDRLVERAVFAPLGIEACLNWIGCSEEMAERAVILYRSTGEVARDHAADRPPHCTIPVADGEACSLEDYVPGTNASIFSPQGGVRIGMMDLAKLGQALIQTSRPGVFSGRVLAELIFSMMATPTDVDFFCGYGAAIQMIEVPGHGCNDTLFGDGRPRIGHAGEAYGLRSGLWMDVEGGSGMAYFVTAVPETAEEDSGGFAPEEVALVRRALEASDR